MPGDSSLRTARAADYDDIIAVVDDWRGRPVHTALPRLFLDHFHQTSLIAERSGGGLAGFLIGFYSPAQRDCAYIQFAGAAPEERGSGLARSLYWAFFDMAAFTWRGFTDLLQTHIDLYRWHCQASFGMYSARKSPARPARIRMERHAR